MREIYGFLLKDQYGNRKYYTGRGGSEWVSIDRNDVLLNWSKEQAEEKATQFLQFTKWATEYELVRGFIGKE